MDPFTAAVLGALAVSPLALTAMYLYDAALGKQDAGRLAWAERLGLELSGTLATGTRGTHSVQMTERVPSTEGSEPTVVLWVSCTHHPGFDAAASKPVWGQYTTISDRLHARGDLDAARRLASDPVAARILPRVGPYQLNNGVLELEMNGRFEDRRIDDMLDRLVELVQAIERMRVLPWTRIAERLSLRLDEDGNTLEGQCVGLAVRAHHNGTSTEVSVRLARPLPGCSIRRTGPSLRLGDPILDGRISVQGEALKPLLQRSHARDSVLAVIHAHPLSEVTEDHVVLRVEGRLQEGLEQAFEDAILLAEALGPEEE